MSPRPPVQPAFTAPSAARPAPARANRSLTLAVMQPYFLPYIGYFQLITNCNLFVLYDNIKYTKKGWINRNRLLRDGKDAMFSLPLQHGADQLNVDQRALAVAPDPHKWLAQLKGAYRHAPCFAQTLPLLEQIARSREVNLFRFLHEALLATCAHLGIRTPIRISSTVGIDHGLKGTVGLPTSPASAWRPAGNGGGSPARCPTPPAGARAAGVRQLRWKLTPTTTPHRTCTKNTDCTRRGGARHPSHATRSLILLQQR